MTNGPKKWEGEVYVEEGKMKRLKIKPEKVAMGYLKVDTLPEGAEVYLDGEKIGRTPLMKEVVAGEHKLVIKKSGRRTVKKKVYVKDGEVERWWRG